MALIKCPECGKEISSLAESCPQCGNPLSTGIKCPNCKSINIEKNKWNEQSWFGIIVGSLCSRKGY